MIISSVSNILTVRTIVGILGNIFSVGLTVLSKWPRSPESMKEYSEIDLFNFFGLLNCSFWILYTSPVASPDHTLYMTMSAAVLVLLVGYFAVLAWYAPKRGKRFILCGMVVAIVLVGAESLCVVLQKPVNKYVNKKSFFSISIAFMLINYMSSELYLPPLWACLASMVDGCIWIIYAQLQPADQFITLANGLVVLLGFFGAIVNWWRKTHTPPVAEADASPVQLQKVVVVN